MKFVCLITNVVMTHSSWRNHLTFNPYAQWMSLQALTTLEKMQIRDYGRDFKKTDGKTIYMDP
jgi:hypothetical protein